MAVSICKGLSVQKLKWRHAVITGLWFGGFQALMPLVGYLLTTKFASFFDPDLIANIDHWVAFVLLSLIGANMIKESCGCAEEVNASFSPRAMFPMAVATSIDAMVAGVALAARPNTNIWVAITLIGVTTFVLSAIGVRIGHIFGARFKSKAELTGGIVLILMGVEILLDDLGVLAWLSERGADVLEWLTGLFT